MTAKFIGSFGNVEQQQSLSQGSNKHVTTCPKWNIISKKQWPVSLKKKKKSYILETLLLEQCSVAKPFLYIFILSFKDIPEKHLFVSVSW